MIRPSTPDALLELLREHGRTHAPHYPPVDNSDHGPMTYLAMHGLGLDFEPIRAFSERYRRKLVPIDPPNESVGPTNWEQHLGRRRSYSALVGFFTAEIDALGWRACADRYLPRLISGWVKDAFHPLIRLGYGIEFEVPSEIAAGLAYMTITGDDPQLVACARRQHSGASGRDFLIGARSMRDPAFARGPFNARYARILADASLTPAGNGSGDVLRAVSRACAEVFDATHDFFALHLVTASHAFRVCAPHAGEGLDALFSTGIAAAYLAIGAPGFAPLAADTVTPPLAGARLARTEDEHDIKLAYSSRAQSQAWADPIYEHVAARYLAPRLLAEA